MTREETAIIIGNIPIDKGDDCYSIAEYQEAKTMAIKALEQEPCEDCKWWKDSDGLYRRGIGAESGCPINRKEVYDGNGYCFLFEKKESEG